MKQCTRENNCVNKNGINGLLNENQFNKKIDGKNGLRSECRECQKLDSLKYGEKNRENIRIKSKEYYSKNKEKVIKRTSKNYNKKKLTIIGKFKLVASSANQRNSIEINHINLICLFVSQNGYCPITNTKLNFKNIHLDHIKPIQNGGTNNYDNLIFLRDVANTGKNGYGLKKYLHCLGDLCSKEQKDSIIKRINDTHNRYEFTIDKFLKMTDEELELIVTDILNKNKDEQWDVVNDIQKMKN